MGIVKYKSIITNFSEGGFMRYISIVLVLAGAVVLMSSYLVTPSRNGDSPGCSCHSLNDGVVSATQSGNLQVEITVNGVSAGKAVAGELVNSEGTVVDVINSTTTNPFTLTAPQEGEYRINAGYASPLTWDSVTVNLVTSDISVDQNISPVTEFKLFSNHPNPFNNETLIRFSVPVAKDLSLTIYNMNGQRVRRLTEGSFSPGIYSFKWDGRNDYGEYVSSGMYIYELRGEGYHTAKRLTLSK
jgi:hypothetical protein